MINVLKLVAEVFFSKKMDGHSKNSKEIVMMSDNHPTKKKTGKLDIESEEIELIEKVTLINQRLMQKMDEK